LGKFDKVFPVGFDEKGKPYLRVKMNKVHSTGDIDRKKATKQINRCIAP